MEQINKNPIGMRRSVQREETKGIILESARALFDKSGFDKTTIRAIAIQAGVGTGTIFNYFPDKPSLLIAALLDDLEKVEESAFKTLPEKATIIEKCLHITSIYYSYYARRPSLSRTLLKESNFIPGEFGDLLKTQINRFIKTIEEMLLEAQKRGEIRMDVDCSLASLTFFSLFFWVLFSGLREPEFKQDELLILIEKLLNQQIKGLGAEKGELSRENILKTS
jgi:AcrR family transcriptional regulator